MVGCRAAAAALLRERFGAQRVAVIGDLVRPEPLGFWSELTLVAQRSLRRLLERERPETVAPERWERYVALAPAGVDGIQRYLVEETPETRTALRERYSNSEAVLGCNPELAVPCNRQFAQLRFDFRRQLVNLIYFAQ